MIDTFVVVVGRGIDCDYRTGGGRGYVLSMTADSKTA